MATFTTFLNMRKADNGDSANVLTDIDAAFTTLDSLFDPAALSAAQAPRVVMRETVHNPTYVGAANTIDLRPVWNAPSGTLRGLFIDATHTGAGANSRVIEVRRSGNPIWDVDITTQNAVNGLSLQGGATTTPAVLRAIGTDTNVGITLQPKGTSSVVLGGPVTHNGDLTNLAAVSRVIPGATSWSVRNNANNQDNLLVGDSGAITVRSSISGVTTITTGEAQLSGNRIYGSSTSNNLRFETYSVTNNNTHQLLTATASFTGLVFVTEDRGNSALYMVHGGTLLSYEVSDPTNNFTPTLTTAGANNIGWNTSQWQIENKTGATRTYSVFALSSI